MPELPELEVYKEILSRELIGKTIETPLFLKPYILKSFPGNYKSRFPAKVTAIERRGKHLMLFLDNGLIICIHLMRSGKIRIQRSMTKPNKFTACTINVDDGRTLQITEYGKEKMARLYIAEGREQLPELTALGIEPFDSSLSTSGFLNLLHKEKRKLKQFLTDQRILAGIGNAYANEILWNAKLSPFSKTASLSEAEAEGLLKAMRETLQHGITETRTHLKGTGLAKDNRQFMVVHNKRGKACPRCGDTIRWVYSEKNTIYYCPTCQTNGRILKDRRTSKFLK